MRRIVMHVDMDAFFASVEQLDRPELRGKPVVVGADPKSGRGVVSAASYEARVFGIHSAQPITQAFRACPQGVFLPPRFSRYSELSHRVFDILESLSPSVEPISIDEAFVELTGTERLLGDPVEVGRRTKREILDATGLVASVGIAPNKFVAKIASDFGKPNGFVVVPEDGVRDFLDPLPIKRLWGVGPKTEAALRAMGIETIRQLAETKIELLVGRFGESGESLRRLAHGEDDRPVSAEGERRGISAEVTYDVDEPDVEKNIATLRRVADRLAARMRRECVSGRTVTAKVRYADFTTITRAKTFAAPVSTADEIFEAALGLARPELVGAIRLLGIRVGSLTGDEGEQLPLFDGAKTEKAKRLERALDDIRSRFGKDSIDRAKGIKREED